MTKRKAPEDLKRRAQDDTTPKPRTVAAKKKGDTGTRVVALRKGVSNNTPELLSPNRPLTEKQRIFVKEWAAGESILSASVRAGYADNGTMAYRLVKDPAILKLYNLEKMAYAASCQMTRQKVMDGLLEGIDLAKTMAEPASMISGWREVGKMCGYYEPVRKKIEISVSGDVTMKHLNKMDDAALLKIIKGEVMDVAFMEVGDGDDGDGSGSDN